MMGPMTAAFAYLGGRWATEVLEVASDLEAVERGGRWAILLPYSGPALAIRFRRWQEHPPELGAVGWQGPATDTWRSSLDEPAYLKAVDAVRVAIAAGSVYQVNICRVLSAELPGRQDCHIAGLAALLQAGNPAPYAGFIYAPELGVEVVTASPELFWSGRRASLSPGRLRAPAKLRLT